MDEGENEKGKWKKGKKGWWVPYQCTHPLGDNYEPSKRQDGRRLLDVIWF